MIIKLDSAFDQIQNLSWYPFVGNDYKGIIILGESNYDTWDGIDAQTSKEWLASKEFTRNRVVGTALKETGAGDKIYRNFERAVYGKPTISDEERNKLWNSTAWMNLVQRPMSSIKERPKREDYRAGWDLLWEINRILNAHTIIAQGTTLQKIQTFRQLLNKWEIPSEEKWSDVANGRSWEICFFLNHPILKKVVFIKHPSTSFSWERCSAFLRICQLFPYLHDQY